MFSHLQIMRQYLSMLIQSIFIMEEQEGLGSMAMERAGQRISLPPNAYPTLDPLNRTAFWNWIPLFQNGNSWRRGYFPFPEC